MSTFFASCASSSFSSSPTMSASTTRWMCFVIAPFFEPVALSSCFSSGRIDCEDLLRGRRDVLDLARAQLPVGPDRGIADELADLLRVLRRELLREVLEGARDERARVLEGRQRLLLGPVVQAAGPEVVVLVEALLGALREVVAPALEPNLERLRAPRRGRRRCAPTRRAPCPRGRRDRRRASPRRPT